MLKLRDQMPVVLALSGGGVPVAVEIATALHADLDVFPVHPIRCNDVTLGLIAEGGSISFDMLPPGVRPRADEVEHAIHVAKRDLRRRALRLRGGRPAPAVAGRTVILVDDGVASGRTVRAALAARRHLSAARLIVAVPVAPTLVARSFERDVDELVCLHLAPALIEVGEAYDDFHPLAETEILGALARGRAASMSQAAVTISDVTIDTASGQLDASLTLPRGALGVVVIPCAGGSERHRARALIRSLADEELGFLVVESSGESPALAGALSGMSGSAWAPELPFGVLGFGEGGRAFVAKLPEASTLPCICIDADEDVTAAASFLRARFSRPLAVVD